MEWGREGDGYKKCIKRMLFCKTSITIIHMKPYKLNKVKNNLAINELKICQIIV